MPLLKRLIIVLYVAICSEGTLFIVAYNLVGSIFRGIGDSKIPLLTETIACVLNIVGDLLLVAVFGMGAVGAAITTGFWETGNLQGAALSIASFNATFLGVWGIIVTLATVFFALSTILGWAYYGEVSMEYLSNNSKTAVQIYRCVYVVFVFLGAVGSLDLVWSISETMNGLMATPNLIGIIGLSKVIKTITTDCFSGLNNK